MDTSDVTVTSDGTTVILACPYDPALPPRAREMGGRFARDGSKTWVFDARDEERVRALARELYGTDGSDADEPSVTLRVPVSDPGWTNEFRLAGRRLAWRRARDEKVRLAAGVVLVEGKFPSRAGSAANPRLFDGDDEARECAAVLEVRDVPQGTADKMLAEQPDVAVVGADGEAAMPTGARLPALPGEIDPNAPVVSFSMHECRTCPEQSPWYSSDDEQSRYDWQIEHEKSQGHDSYYVWTVSRNTARTFVL